MLSRYSFALPGNERVNYVAEQAMQHQEGLAHPHETPAFRKQRLDELHGKQGHAASRLGAARFLQWGLRGLLRDLEAEGSGEPMLNAYDGNAFVVMVTVQEIHFELCTLRTRLLNCATLPWQTYPERDGPVTHTSETVACLNTDACAGYSALHASPFVA